MAGIVAETYGCRPGTALSGNRVGRSRYLERGLHRVEVRLTISNNTIRVVEERASAIDNFASWSCSAESLPNFGFHL